MAVDDRQSQLQADSNHVQRQNDNPEAGAVHYQRAQNGEHIRLVERQSAAVLTVAGREQDDTEKSER
jgi:hypothetical protein